MLIHTVSAQHHLIDGHKLSTTLRIAARTQIRQHRLRNVQLAEINAQLTHSSIRRPNNVAIVELIIVGGTFQHRTLQLRRFVEAEHANATDAGREAARPRCDAAAQATLQPAVAGAGFAAASGALGIALAAEYRVGCGMDAVRFVQ